MVLGGEQTVHNSQAILHTLVAFLAKAQVSRENFRRKEVIVINSDLRDSEQFLSLGLNGFMMLQFQDKRDGFD